MQMVYFVVRARSGVMLIRWRCERGGSKKIEKEDGGISNWPESRLTCLYINTLPLWDVQVNNSEFQGRD